MTDSIEPEESEGTEEHSEILRRLDRIETVKPLYYGYCRSPMQRFRKVIGVS
jgi:hypothetical protein